MTASKSQRHGHGAGATMVPAGDRVIDPVCGMTVDIHAGKPTYEP